MIARRCLAVRDLTAERTASGAVPVGLRQGEVRPAWARIRYAFRELASM